MSKPRLRGNGQGSIFFREQTNRWVAQIWVDGKKVQRTARTSAEADYLLTTLKAEAYKGLPIVTSAEPTLAYLRSFLETHPVDAYTTKRYRSLIELHTGSIAKIQLKKLTPQHIRLLEHRAAATLSSTTVLQLHWVLNAALEQAVADRLLAFNPCDSVKAPKKAHHEHTVLSPDEATRFVTACRGSRREALFLTALTTGMRAGELRGLRWRNVDLENRFLSVNSNFVDGIFKDTKGHGRRRLDLSPPAIQSLRRHRTIQAEEKLKAGSRYLDDDLVFANNVGPVFNPPNIKRDHFTRLLVEAECPLIEFKELRHSYATLSLLRRVDIYTVSRRLGHASADFTLRTYIHLVQAGQEAAAVALDYLFEPTTLTA